jgi:hypothetical protein
MSAVIESGHSGLEPAADRSTLKLELQATSTVPGQQVFCGGSADVLAAGAPGQGL